MRQYAIQTYSCIDTTIYLFFTLINISTNFRLYQLSLHEAIIWKQLRAYGIL